MHTKPTNHNVVTSRQIIWYRDTVWNDRLCVVLIWLSLGVWDLRWWHILYMLSLGIVEFWQEQDTSREVTELEGDGGPCIICWPPRCRSERSTPQGRKWHHTERCKCHWVVTSQSLIVVSVAVYCVYMCRVYICICIDIQFFCNNMIPVMLPFNKLTQHNTSGVIYFTNCHTMTPVVLHFHKLSQQHDISCVTFSQTVTTTWH